MKPIINTLLFVSILLWGVTCKSEDQIGREIFVASYIDNALDKSPTFKSFKNRVKHASYLVEESNQNFCIIRIGENFKDRFMVEGVLKILRNGVILRQDDPLGLSNKWVVEYRPPNLALQK